ncbi:MAG TPA: ABC transporter permease [Trebonia sp.]|jgi:peptide/nickel transport system permease protein|nr:ABC transporter permease [Trebonia sp.]
MRLLRAIAGNAKAATGAVMLLAFIVLALFPGLFAADSPTAEAYKRNLGASGAHLLGTTGLGQDTFAQAVYGTREVLEIAFGAGLASTVLAALIGVAAAYLGGLWDGVLSLFTDMVLVIPLFPLLIVISAYVHNSGSGVLIAVLTLTGWSYTARQLRSQALALRSRDFLAAAKVRGERAIYIIVVEILPTMISLLVAAFLTNALYDVLFASSLQFIGLGDPDATSWGTMLYWAQNNEALQAGFYIQAIVPGAAIALLGAAFALLNYAFDEIGNPALRPVRTRRRLWRGPGVPGGIPLGKHSPRSRSSSLGTPAQSSGHGAPAAQISPGRDRA